MHNGPADVNSAQFSGNLCLYRTIADFVKLQRFDNVSAAGDQPMTKLSEYVKTADAANLLGVSQNTLRAWAEAGKIPVHRNPANGYRLFLKADLERFLRTVANSGTKRRVRRN